MRTGNLQKVIRTGGHQASSDATSSREYELKLIGTSRDIGAIKTRIDRFLNDASGWRSQALETVYFDTFNRDLATANAVLRVRKAGRTYIQCVKIATGSGSILNRREWEVPVPSAAPDFALLPPEAVKALADATSTPINPMFATRFRRRYRLIERPTSQGEVAQIEVAIDKGTVEAGALKVPIHEVEFELKRGEPQDLFDLVLAVTDGTSLRPSSISKAARGHLLLEGTSVAQAAFARKTQLKAGRTVTDTLAEVFQSGLATLAANEAAATLGDDPEGVHQMRVAVRRMRSALSVFEPFFDSDCFAWAKTDLKWLLNTLRQARDWDVFITEIVSPVQGVGIDAAGQALVLEASRQQRDAGYLRASELIASTGYAQVVMRLTAFSETHGWLTPSSAKPGSRLMQPIDSVASGLLTKTHKKVLKAGRGFETLSVKERHTLRIQIKKLRYTADIFRNLYDTPKKTETVRTYRQFMKRLQDRFGHMNDVAGAENLASDLRASAKIADADRESFRAAISAVLGWHARGLHDAEDDLIRDWHDFRQLKPFWSSKG